MRQFIMGLPPDLLDAGRVDGVGELGVHVRPAGLREPRRVVLGGLFVGLDDEDHVARERDLPLRKLHHSAREDGHASIVMLLLTGLAVNALFMSAIGFLSYIARDPQARSITFWSLGFPVFQGSIIS